MKIRSKIALRYTAVTAILMLTFAIIVFFVSSKDREKEFYEDLKKEGISKANLYFEAKATPEVMHSIYKNNIEYINEVEVAIYDENFGLLYHDAKDIDIVKETPQLLEKILNTPKGLSFYEDKYQAIGFLFTHHDTDYIVTAAAYDGYGFAKLNSLIRTLFILCVISILLSFIIGYILAKRALKPVTEISDKMKDITANNLNLRLLRYNENDEFGELAASFNKALDIIESSFESQKMFVSNVSHELRTPLAALIGEIDFALLKDRSSEEYKDTLINSRQDTNRLIRLLNGLLDLAKASYDESKISMNIIRVDEMLLDARELVLKGNPDYNIELLFNQEIGDDSEITIKGNEYLLRMAFANLMENNCKFSANKTSTVYISYYNNKIVVQFSDTGIGIPENEVEHLFTPFFRGSNKTFVQGNGIGLALVKRVITLHKGNISLKSVVGESSTFRVEFKNTQPST